jgi:adenine phosphoribosyltransferase
MMMELQQHMSQVIEMEKSVWITTDGVLHKATQENAEFVEAFQSGELEKIVDEAWDAIINTLSATHRITGQIPHDYPIQSTDVISLMIQHGKLNDALQTVRGQYSRHNKVPDLDKVQALTQSYVGWVLWLVQPHQAWLTVEDFIHASIIKMESRMDMYRPQLDLNKYIVNVPDFPKPWILFKDISPILQSPEAFDYAVKMLAVKARDADVIMWLDARWFLFGGAVARELGKPLVIARKPGKLPREQYSVKYSLEYGSNELCMHQDAILPGQKVAVIDDLLATGGTARAANDLIMKAQWVVEGNYFVIGLDELGGEAVLQGKVESLLNC